MNIKQKIWSIPILTILIFSLGMAVVYQYSSQTYTLLQRTHIIHYPYLHHIQTLSGYLKGIQENLQNAVVINDSNAITRAPKSAGFSQNRAGNIDARGQKNNFRHLTKPI